MSLINDVLRDIDRRQGRHGSVSALFDDTVTVPPLRRKRWPPAWLMLLSVSALLLALGVLLVQVGERDILRTAPEPQQMAATVSVPPATRSAAETPAHASAAIEDMQRPTPAGPDDALSAPAAAPAAAQPAAVVPLAAPQAVRVPAAMRVNLRRSPDLGAEVIEVVDAATPLTALAQSGAFLQVRTAAGVSGWISAAHVRAEPLPPAALRPEPHTAPRPAPAVPAHTEPDAPALHALALQQLQQGRQDAAEATLLRALALAPDHRAALNALAALMLQQQRRSELETLLAGRLANTGPAASLLLARLRLERGDQAGSAQALGELGDTPLDGDQLTVLAALQQRLGRHPEAVATYRRAIEQGARSGTSWAGLAVSLDALGDAAAARAAWQAAQAAGNLDPALARHAADRLAALKDHGD